MQELIKEALSKLDPNNNDHWTTEGLPRLDVMNSLLGKSVTRQEVTSADTTFSRKSALEALTNPKAEHSNVEQAPTQTQAAPQTAEQTAQTAEQVPQTAPTQAQEPDKEIVKADPLTEDELVVKEYEESRIALHEAQKRFKAATMANDALILRRQASDESESDADKIRRFQESQLKERKQSAERAKVLLELQKAQSIIA